MQTEWRPGTAGRALAHNAVPWTTSAACAAALDVDPSAPEYGLLPPAFGNGGLRH
ncbi:MAG: hypothetical protein R2851_25335 [Caldilineaceae bacterium]